MQGSGSFDKGVRMLGGVLLAAATSRWGCGTGVEAAENTTLTLSETLDERSQVAEGPVRHLGKGGPAGGLERWLHEAERCDTEPETTTVDVCGTALPATQHFAWTDCQRPAHAPRHAPPPDARADGGGRPHTPPSSSGTVDVVHTVEPVGACGEGAVYRYKDEATVAVSHTSPKGHLVTVAGTHTSESMHAPEATLFSRTSTVDTTHTATDSEGNVVRSIHLSGTEEVTFDSSGETPTRTSRGTMVADLGEGRSDRVTEKEVVRVPPSVCRWPVGGTLEHTTPEGTTHVLSFGPECGQATLDGAAVDLSERRGGGRGGPRRGPPPAGAPSGSR
jgi:hypothetical protein